MWGVRGGSWARLMPRSWACCLQRGQVLRNWLPHLALPRVGTVRGGTNLWLKGMNPRGARRGQQTDSCHPQMGKAFLLAGEAWGLQCRCWRVSWACIPDGICSKNCWRSYGLSGSKECTRSLQAEVLSRHWDPTEQRVEKTLEPPPACPREWNVPCFASVKPQVRRIDQERERASPGYCSPATSWVLCLHNIARSVLNYVFLSLIGRQEGCQGYSDTEEPSSNFQPKFIDGQFTE